LPERKSQRGAAPTAFSQTYTVPCSNTRARQRAHILEGLILALADIDAAWELLDIVGLTEYATQRADSLSGGQRQRVGIARAIMQRPEILLADEPTGNLDSRTGQSILDLLRDLNRAEGATVVMVTHDAFAAAYGHRTLEIQDGAIVRDVRTPASPMIAAASSEFRFQ